MMRGDLAEGLARRSFVIAKTHLISLLRQEVEVIAKEIEEGSKLPGTTQSRNLMFVEVQKVAH